ncbi:Nuclear envelope protein ndc1 [Neolecta irregularis DAH-3]|uniref:Nuclear envelope protein ndc1 n=1 Tax=Neolecta irregularis (strain DAH-3) TaxID=1198029 RepID=A0A1U7LJS2_NEOID|nr:Nuclear envelope protein ndc1 [Neolecta irregularis DAH-3]|eukprot:OLL22905.1 Nuclear envelope protein ndc1 [Neolecta irregularis DAH-3]
MLPVFPLGPELFLRSFWLSFRVVTLWQLSRLLFNVYLSQGPIVKGRTVSSKSAEPNGSLITGLQVSQKELTQLMAFEELLYIANHDETRRASIFKEVHRSSSSSAWKQISEECLKVTSQIMDNLRTLGIIKPPQSSNIQPQQTMHISSLGSPILVKSENIFVTGAQPRRTLDKLKSTNQGPSSPTSPLAKIQLPPAQELTQKAQAAASDWMTGFYASWIGWPFRETLQFKSQMIIPKMALQVAAISALSKFIVRSIKEDDMGLVQHDIPRILESLLVTETALKRFVKRPPVHPTDIESLTSPKPIILEEISSVLKAIDFAFSDVVETFGVHLSNLKLAPEVIERCQEIMDSSM